MPRFHAPRLALLCCAIVAVLAGCGGSGSNVQPNYGSLANGICGKFSDATKSNPDSAKRIQAIETALSGLQGLHPPTTVQTMYTHLLYHFKIATVLLKANIDELGRLAKRIDKHPNDKVAARRYARIAGRIQRHLRLAAADAHSLGLGRCEAVFTS